VPETVDVPEEVNYISLNDLSAEELADLEEADDKASAEAIAAEKLAYEMEAAERAEYEDEMEEVGQGVREEMVREYREEMQGIHDALNGPPVTPEHDDVPAEDTNDADVDQNVPPTPKGTEKPKAKGKAKGKTKHNASNAKKARAAKALKAAKNAEGKTEAVEEQPTEAGAYRGSAGDYGS
jgi:hypothetical protein